MWWLLASISVGIFLLSIGIQGLWIRLSLKRGWVDIPDARRRHGFPVPVLGGVALLFTWCIGFLAYSAYDPSWFAQHMKDWLVLVACMGMLMLLGIADDLRGIGPKAKLTGQALATVALILFFSPANEFCLHWQDKIGWAIWPLVSIWLIGMSNAINLVDGLDTLASGTVLLVAVTLAFLSWNGLAGPTFVWTLLLIPALLGFLYWNRHPARVFLGDNGSLPLGFFIGAMALTFGPGSNQSTVKVLSIGVMMGYPILDMGLCTWRRITQKTKIFKADRNHLHHRIQRLGLSVPQTAVFLLSISFYLQLAAVAIHSLQLGVALTAIAAVFASLFSLFYFLTRIEIKRVQELSDAYQSQAIAKFSEEEPNVSFSIDLAPLFEVGLHEERIRLGDLIESLKVMLRRSLREEDVIEVRGQELLISMRMRDTRPETVEQMKLKLNERLIRFKEAFEVQYSASELFVRATGVPQ